MSQNDDQRRHCSCSQMASRHTLNIAIFVTLTPAQWQPYYSLHLILSLPHSTTCRLSATYSRRTRISCNSWYCSNTKLRRLHEWPYTTRAPIVSTYDMKPCPHQLTPAHGGRVLLSPFILWRPWCGQDKRERPRHDGIFSETRATLASCKPVTWFDLSSRR